ncbi:hypothetical protein BKA65DRAFT_599281 [Rhexocercosporidium sp. MPI-PUGE-AT-0058]|nr:hypothetical protein BKA65DRAFT_599281 [Rhexocercosporidium sp. MPI-PUGE-AT-0058]
MAPSTSNYSYTSQLPFMFTLVGMVCKSKPRDNGFTEEQTQLWATVIENRDRILQSSPHRDDDPTIQQYKLELWSWNRFWPERPFPGSKPKKIENEDADAEYTAPFDVDPKRKSGNDISTHSHPSQSHPLSTESRINPGYHIFSHPPSPTRSYPIIQPPSEASLYSECRNAILQHKGADHIPYHGWDVETGLPRYSIISTASNGFLVFCGPRQQYFRVLKAHFFSTARIMYQRARAGLMIIWIEAPTYNHAVEFRTNTKMWNEFKSCWAFLKCWAEAAGEGPADNIADFLQGWRPDVRQFEELEMEFPPLEVNRQYSQKEGGF